MAPSFTRTADEGSTELGGVKIGGAGYNTIVGMIPTVDTVRLIADDDELISSFRPYRIDALRAARAAEATEESAPHPDDARYLEPTLCTLAANRLIDAGAIPDDVAQEYWPTASTFGVAAMGEGDIAASLLSTGPAEGLLHAASTLPRGDVPTGTSSFLMTPRFRERRSLPGVRQPELGHYHQRYTQVEPRVVGGYIAPRESAAPKGRASPMLSDQIVTVEVVPEPQPSQPSVGALMAESSRGCGFSTVAYRSATMAGASSSQPHAASPPPVKGSSMFVSKTVRIPLATCSAAKDLAYYPYADVRSTVKRSRCPVKFDVTLTQRRHDGVSTTAVVGMYDFAGDIAENPHRVVCMDRDTGRAGDWRNKPPAPQSQADFVDVGTALKMVRPRTRSVTMAPRISEDDDAQKRAKAPDNTVSIERDLNFPRSIFDHCEARRVRQFATMAGRSSSAPMTSHEAPDNVEMTLVTKRTPCPFIHPTAPGHVPLHRPNTTEIGDVPNLKWTKPTTERTTDFGIVSSTPPTQLPMRDLWYDTSKRALVEPRLTGNPMIETQVSREKRAKIFTTTGCGAHAVYNTDIPQHGKSVPLFEKQITKETQFCGHRLQSERWQRKNPKAPGPGHYTVSYRLVE
ncbi:hypothetical protein DQ04_04521020 [Trypanosoma grayi]|uniref:hypothetical protein n=1 Tax=Trypanosoma grayi TaxID=71804 RepID=UPI0004F472BB|nr:hypothetical protein DQ04_04521020 [Trypanosoma grayi]KEG09861.1 hypothetical protein DQ04_04521020 [Trypanosoma grayi]